jgi:ArsR family transcriptional regulator
VISTKGTDLARTARWFHALSDETRLLIIERLSEGELCVCDLTEALRTGQSRLSFHLRILKDAGLLNGRREGRWMYYSLNPETVDELHEWLASLKDGIRVRIKSQCCE